MSILTTFYLMCLNLSAPSPDPVNSRLLEVRDHSVQLARCLEGILEPIQDSMPRQLELKEVTPASDDPVHLGNKSECQSRSLVPSKYLERVGRRGCSLDGTTMGRLVLSTIGGCYPVNTWSRISRGKGSRLVPGPGAGIMHFLCLDI